jgi:GNAT superfamily N-acetyltransferase
MMEGFVAEFRSARSDPEHSEVNAATGGNDRARDESDFAGARALGRMQVTYRLEVKANATNDDRTEIWRRIEAFNDAYTGPEEDRPLAILVSDAEDGSPRGGLFGRSYYGWLFIELLIIDASLRGQGVGTQLMRRAEEEASRRGCHGVWLDSFSFQAPGFYQRLGYEVFGVLEDYPPGDRRFFLRKRLDAGQDQRAATAGSISEK